MPVQIPLPEEARAPENKDPAGIHEILPDLAYRRTSIVNVIFWGRPGGGWVLIDTGIPGSAEAIRKAATDRFGADSRPAAIVLTHGHFDHVGAVETLSREWDVPVIAHPLEASYLDGTNRYLPPDTEAAGGLIPKLASLFPRDPVDVSERLSLLPGDGTVPAMPGWRALHTPGHTPGHVSLWRESDRTLIAGDAIITTGQESAYEVLVQTPEMHGPPRYFTPDWSSAASSVRRLAALDPELVITGHGRAMRGRRMREALHVLADNFDAIALPQASPPPEVRQLRS